MPELPEVEVVRRGLARAVVGATVTAVEVRDERALKRHLGDGADFDARLVGRRFAAPSRRGKYLWIPFADDPAQVLFAHLGMSGQLLVRRIGASDERQLRVRIRIEGPEGDLDLRFIDQRLFGSLAIDDRVPAPDAPDQSLPSMAVHIARDPLDPRFDPELVLDRLRRTDRGIKSVLLDQCVVSGIGNIYADEALWRARRHGAQPASSLSPRAGRAILGHVRDVFEEAIAQGGTSFDALYVNVNGESGYFSRTLQAYGRTGEPCLRCGTPIRRIVIGGRSSHFCPRCQRKRGSAGSPAEPGMSSGRRRDARSTAGSFSARM